MAATLTFLGLSGENLQPALHCPSIGLSSSQVLELSTEGVKLYKHALVTCQPWPSGTLDIILYQGAEGGHLMSWATSVFWGTPVSPW